MDLRNPNHDNLAAAVQMMVCRRGYCDLYRREGSKECEDVRSDGREISKEEEKAERG
jgi:hypothetical protein